MYNIQKLKDTDWNNAKEVTAKEIAEYLFSLTEKEVEETDETLEVNAPDFVIEKLNECSRKREKEIHSAIQAMNSKKVYDVCKLILSDRFEEYDLPANDGEMENSTLRGLHNTLTINGTPYGSYFLPPADDATKWIQKKQISKIAEAKIIAKYLHEAEKKSATLKKNIEATKKLTNQQKRNQTDYTTITQWNQALKEQIIKELTAIKTPIFKANRIASKCTSVVKKIISKQ